MGMFDSLYGSDGTEYQTKAFDCVLATIHIGDKMPSEIGAYYGTWTIAPDNYQVEVIRGGLGADAYATIRDGRLAECPAERDLTLPLYNYIGDLGSDQ